MVYQCKFALGGKKKGLIQIALGLGLNKAPVMCPAACAVLRVKSSAAAAKKARHRNRQSLTDSRTRYSVKETPRSPHAPTRPAADVSLLSICCSWIRLMSVLSALILSTSETDLMPSTIPSAFTAEYFYEALGIVQLSKPEFCANEKQNILPRRIGRAWQIVYKQFVPKIAGSLRSPITVVTAANEAGPERASWL